MEWINLVSDTVTKPTKGMLQAMMKAEVGDDVFREDPTVNALEEKAAALFGKEAALFCPSGTMTNQIAIKLLKGNYGKITAEQVESSINPIQDWLPKSTLVVLENTTNIGGGNYYTLPEIEPIKAVCTQRNLKLHLDGARIFNALVETQENPSAVGKVFDSISICLSKGLGTPVGSVLVGNTDFIKFARRIRKAMGGGMRQAGFLAAAGIYALDNHVERLKEDHENAQKLAKTLEKLDFVENIRPVKTNILIFDVKQPKYSAASFVEALNKKGIKSSTFGPQTVRFVTHLDFTKPMLQKVLKTLEGM